MIDVVRYCTIDGVPTFRDSDIMALYDRMMADGTDKIVFFAGDVSSRDAFLKRMRDSICIVALIDCDPVGVGWLTNIVGKQAQGHFCLFSNGWGDMSKDIGVAMLTYMFGLTSGGSPLFDCFYGILPTSNFHALEFAIECGGEIVGTIPNMIYMVKTGVSEEATILHFQRGVYHG